MIALTAPVAGGLPQFSREQQKIIANTYLGLEGKRATVRIAEYKSVRTNEQNRYIWGVVYEAIAAETGYSPEEVHELMKTKFAPRRFVTMGSIEAEIPRSTTTMDTKEMAKFIDRIVAFAATELSITISPPHYNG